PSWTGRGASSAWPGSEGGGARSVESASLPTSCSPNQSSSSFESMSSPRCIMPQGPRDFKVSASEGQVVQALGGIAGATLLSRLLGFVRDLVAARAFGAGPVSDGLF